MYPSEEAVESKTVRVTADGSGPKTGWERVESDLILLWSAIFMKKDCKSSPVGVTHECSHDF
jgi:hypothetical protein